MEANVGYVISQGTQIAAAILALWGIGYIAYMRYLHPLAKYPGPFAASLTDLWKAYTMYQGQMEYVVRDLHDKHGAIVRIGPNDLVISHPDAVKQIYLSGSSFLKTKFYNGYTAAGFRANVFATQDEPFHSIRRRQLSYSFSQASISQMEGYIDGCLSQMVDAFDNFARSGETFDLKLWIRLYIFDVLGELAFSQSYGALKAGNDDILPPIGDHVRLGTVAGQFPEYATQITKYASRLPIEWIRVAGRSRASMRDLTIRCVDKRVNEKNSKRTDLLTRLIEAKDPVTGETLDIGEIRQEAFGMIVAGSHTTATTMTFLFYHLLHSPQAMEKLVCELNQSNPGTRLATVEGLGDKKYFQACIKENFRYTPTFVMPLPRHVPEGGREIAGEFIPGGTTVSIVNHALHRNKLIFGEDADDYMPERWLDAAYAAEMDKYVIPFSAGHRSCLGRNMATTNIQKVVATVLRRYHIEAVDIKKELKTFSVGITELEGPLFCKVRFRKPQE